MLRTNLCDVTRFGTFGLGAAYEYLRSRLGSSWTAVGRNQMNQPEEPARETRESEGRFPVSGQRVGVIDWRRALNSRDSSWMRASDHHVAMVVSSHMYTNGDTDGYSRGPRGPSMGTLAAAARRKIGTVRDAFRRLESEGFVVIEPMTGHPNRYLATAPPHIILALDLSPVEGAPLEGDVPRRRGAARTSGLTTEGRGALPSRVPLNDLNQMSVETARSDAAEDCEHHFVDPGFGTLICSKCHFEKERNDATGDA
jgi:hypothetical protein